MAMQRLGRPSLGLSRGGLSSGARSAAPAPPVGGLRAAPALDQRQAQRGAARDTFEAAPHAGGVNLNGRSAASLAPRDVGAGSLRSTQDSLGGAPLLAPAAPTLARAAPTSSPVASTLAPAASTLGPAASTLGPAASTLAPAAPLLSPAALTASPEVPEATQTPEQLAQALTDEQKLQLDQALAPLNDLPRDEQAKRLEELVAKLKATHPELAAYLEALWRKAARGEDISADLAALGAAPRTSGAAPSGPSPEPSSAGERPGPRRASGSDGRDGGGGQGQGSGRAGGRKRSGGGGGAGRSGGAGGGEDTGGAEEADNDVQGASVSGGHAHDAGDPQAVSSLEGAVPGTGPTEGLQVDPRLQGALEAIAKDPEGAKLLEAAKAAGLTSITVNPGLPEGTAGVARFPAGGGSSSIEIKDPNSPALIHTLVHELGHAATPHDGNSLAEEKAVDAIGARVHERLTGRPSGFQLNVEAYRGLRLENDVRHSLRRIGIAA